MKQKYLFKILLFICCLINITYEKKFIRRIQENNHENQLNNNTPKNDSDNLNEEINPFSQNDKC